MGWIADFLRSLFYSLCDLINWLNTDLEILGTDFKPIWLVSGGLIGFCGAMLLLRIARG